MRILYLSQIVADDDPRRELLPDESVEIPRIFAALGVEVEVVDVTRHAPPSPVGFDGVVVGGCVGSVNEPVPWRIRLEDWVRAHADVPFFGICGGHQLRARALGGQVAPMGREQLGVYALAEFGHVVQMHGETVITVPPGAEVWATDDFGIQALRYGPQTWTVQFHPEVNRDMVAAGARLSGLNIDAWTDLDDAIHDGRKLIALWLGTLSA